MTKKCTWSMCASEATKDQIAKDGEVWASLCAEHDTALEDSLNGSNPAKLLSLWIKAQGGSARAAERMAKAGRSKA